MRHGGDQVASVLKGRKVPRVFTLIGGHVSPILVGCRSSNIPVVDVRHEATAVFAADATARLTGIPGVAVVTAGPGVTNTVTAVKNAQMAQSPVIIIGGATATLLKGRGALQDIEQKSVLKPHVKGLWQVKKIRELTSILNEAFNCSQAGIPGPVFVEVPLDLLYPESIVRDLYSNPSGQSWRAKFQNKYIEWHLNRIFTAGDKNEPVPPTRHYLKTPNVAPIVNALKKAKRPLMIMGSPVVSNPENVQDVIQSIENIGVPVYLTGMTRGLLGRKCDLQFRHHRKDALREADFVLLAGVATDFRLNYGRQIRSSAFLVSVHPDVELLKLNRKPNIGIHGNPVKVLLELARQMPSSKIDRKDWFQSMEKRERERIQEIETKASESMTGINPLALFNRLEELIPENALLVADGGDFVATAAYTLSPRSPLSWLDPGAFGTLGVGGGFAIGAALACPESEIWIFWGDGACGFSLTEFEALARQKIGVIAVVGNDGGWTQIVRDQVELLGDDVACGLSQTDYHIVAEGLGGRGIKISSLEEITNAVAQAREWAGQGIPVLINVILGKSDFRKGSISV
ncbi:MAG: thiamine pyrophosphate-binding protein [Candidatus Marinimicrobia bacterium]|nr:thiamine pyrophosphate-binding protein [Candidatus Neomarinimicrobiota bacterium]MBL7030290.1 thiamine pyrophosphate-binding protein [Candidatus Neomarinimicrobiota bacterium]